MPVASRQRRVRRPSVEGRRQGRPCHVRDSRDDAVRHPYSRIRRWPNVSTGSCLARVDRLRSILNLAAKVFCARHPWRNQAGREMLGHRFVNPANKMYPRDCDPIGEILERVGGKWTTSILAVLGDRRMRTKDLHLAIKGISQRMLIVRLRDLERDGLMIRIVHATVPPRVEYELSELGRSLREILEPVGTWFLANQHAIEKSRRRFDGDGSTTAPG